MQLKCEQTVLESTYLQGVLCRSGKAPVFENSSADLICFYIPGISDRVVTIKDLKVFKLEASLCCFNRGFLQNTWKSLIFP